MVITRKKTPSTDLDDRLYEEEDSNSSGGNSFVTRRSFA